MLCENFKEKNKKTSLVVSCPKLQCCQKTVFGHLGVKIAHCGQNLEFSIMPLLNFIKKFLLKDKCGNQNEQLKLQFF